MSGMYREVSPVVEVTDVIEEAAATRTETSVGVTEPFI